MQAQHKAVLKDLKIATFDDKIDSYLGNVPGLEAAPRAHAAAVRARDHHRARRSGGEQRGDRHRDPGGRSGAGETPSRRRPRSRWSPTSRAMATPMRWSRKPRRGSQRRRKPRARRPMSISARRRGPSRRSGRARRRAIAASCQDRRKRSGDRRERETRPVPTPLPPRLPSVKSPPPIPGRRAPLNPQLMDSSPEIEIIQGDDSTRTRGPRDTDINEIPFEASAVPAAVDADHTRPSDGIPGRIGHDSVPPLPSRPPAEPRRGDVAADAPARRARRSRRRRSSRGRCRPSSATATTPTRSRSTRPRHRRQIRRPASAPAVSAIVRRGSTR